MNLGYIRKDGKVCTEASYWEADRDLADDYNQCLARLFGGQVRVGRRKTDGTDEYGSPVRMEASFSSKTSSPSFRAGPA